MKHETGLQTGDKVMVRRAYSLSSEQLDGRMCTVDCLIKTSNKHGVYWAVCLKEEGISGGGLFLIEVRLMGEEEVAAYENKTRKENSFLRTRLLLNDEIKMNIKICDMLIREGMEAYGMNEEMKLFQRLSI